MIHLRREEHKNEEYYYCFVLNNMFEHKINVNKKDNKNQTILHLALEIGFCEFVKFLFIKNLNLEFCKGIFFR